MNPYKDKNNLGAFNWPKESVRALITLFLVLSTVFLSAWEMYELFIIKSINSEIMKTIDVIRQGVTGLTLLMLGSYIKK